VLAAPEQTGLHQTLLDRLAEARTQSDKLFGLIRPEYLYKRPIAERHRFIFYLGHLEAFDWNLLQSRLLHAPAFDSALDQLFAFGIDPVDGGLPADQPADWPALAGVHRYVDRIRREIDTGLARAAASESSDLLLNTAIEHRLMHVETLAYMLHQLPREGKIGESQAPVTASGDAVSEMIEIAAGPAYLGRSHRDGGFGWDNEYDAHTVDVPAFSIDRYKVTNGQYLAFLEAGGYQDQSLWTEAGWRWRSQQNITHPAFWKFVNGAWRCRGMFDEFALPLDWPVYVSQAEASAFARWSGKALPSEAEWQRAAYDDPHKPFPWGEEAPGPQHGYLGFGRWDPAPVNAFPRARSSFGVDGLLGNGWEWTSTPFQPFAGFQAREFYPGYSANFFDGAHYVMKGASMRTAACMLRRSFRNWFQPHYQYVYAGFRCVDH
jgi:ergothioneine biosynthesis protein EgtB